MQRWQNWINTCFQQPTKDTIPQITHIPDEAWETQKQKTHAENNDLETNHPELTEVRETRGCKNYRHPRGWEAPHVQRRTVAGASGMWNLVNVSN